jgi:hypothetical protein
MAAAPSIPAPPSGQPAGPQGSSPAASPAPARPNPQANQAAQGLIEVVAILRGIAQSYPEAAPLVAQANNLIRDLQLVLMRSAASSEPAAPPVPS